MLCHLQRRGASAVPLSQIGKRMRDSRSPAVEQKLLKIGIRGISPQEGLQPKVHYQHLMTSSGTFAVSHFGTECATADVLSVYS